MSPSEEDVYDVYVTQQTDVKLGLWRRPADGMGDNLSQGRYVQRSAKIKSLLFTLVYFWRENQKFWVDYSAGSWVVLPQDPHWSPNDDKTP